jgi:hypothetical protein
MINLSKSFWLFLIPLASIVFLILIGCSTSTEDTGFEISIDVAPKVLNLQNKGQVVTVHTDISYYYVEVSTVYLNSIEIDSWKSDDNGFFVAKFVMDSIKNLPLNIDEFNTLKLVGKTTDNQSFWGEADIKVIDI